MPSAPKSSRFDGAVVPWEESVIASRLEWSTCLNSVSSGLPADTVRAMSADVTTQVAAPKAERSELARPSDAGRVLAMWIGIRAGIWLWMLGFACLSGVDAGRRASDPIGWVVDRLVVWDSTYFISIAQHGYNPVGTKCCDQAFFPGDPLAIRALTPLFGDARIAALAIPLSAGAVAAMLLWLITVDEFGAAAGWHAVVLLALAPYGVFLSLADSESLVLALALAAWYAARRQRWWWAGLAASAAALVRVNGVFLAVALAVMWMAARRRSREPGVRQLSRFCCLLQRLAPTSGTSIASLGRHGPKPRVWPGTGTSVGPGRDSPGVGVG